MTATTVTTTAAPIYDGGGGDARGESTYYNADPVPGMHEQPEYAEPDTPSKALGGMTYEMIQAEQAGGPMYADVSDMRRNNHYDLGPSEHTAARTAALSWTLGSKHARQPRRRQHATYIHARTGVWLHCYVHEAKLRNNVPF